MKRTIQTLAILVLITTFMSSVVTSVHAAAWVGHKFKLQLPDGKTKDLKGAKLHIFHKQHQDGGASAFHNTCYYPEKENADEDWDKQVEEEIGSAFCATPSSCSIIDYGAPYLPADFNDNRDVHSGGGIYEKDNASYKAFYGKTFSDALKADAPFAYLATKYEKGNIRGFAGAKWKGTVDYSVNEDGDKVGMATQAEIDVLNNNPNWGNNIRYIDGKQRWEEGEVFRDPLGGNVLHGQITWVLKAPAAPAAEKPTASLVGKCATNTPGVPSYTYTLSNINLKGGTFKSSHLHLNVTKGAWTNEFKQQFGPPIYESTAANGIMSYSLIFTTTAPASNSINWTVAPTEGVGNQASNTKTVADLVKWVDAKKAAGVTIPFEIKTNLEAEKDGQTVLNDSITVASNGFKPKFLTNECGAPPPPTPPPTTPPTGGGGAPACVSISLLDNFNKPLDISKLKVGNRVSLQCGNVPGVGEYRFRVLEINSKGQLAKTVNLSAVAPSINRSNQYTIPQNGKFMAQCTICINGTCQNFPDHGLQPGNPDPVPTPTPVPSPGSLGNCEPTYACTTKTECNPSKGTYELAGYACPTAGQVCCTAGPQPSGYKPPCEPTYACVSASQCTANQRFKVVPNHACSGTLVCCEPL